MPSLVDHWDRSKKSPVRVCEVQNLYFPPREGSDGRDGLPLDASVIERAASAVSCSCPSDRLEMAWTDGPVEARNHVISLD
eukprot:scaffold5665_cov92-Skeletonema_dohrnii-CCMP3373.AAC.3